MCIPSFNCEVGMWKFWLRLLYLCIVRLRVLYFFLQFRYRLLYVYNYRILTNCFRLRAVWLFIKISTTIKLIELIFIWIIIIWVVVNKLSVIRVVIYKRISIWIVIYTNSLWSMILSTRLNIFFLDCVQKLCNLFNILKTNLYNLPEQIKIKSFKQQLFI